MKRTAMPPRKAPMNRTGRKRAKPPAFPSAPKPELYLDCEGIAFSEVRGLWLPESLSKWPKVTRVTDLAVRARFRSKPCANCPQVATPRYQSDPHHLTGGSKGRSDEYTNILPLCRACHERFQSDPAMFGWLLFLKWQTDRAHTSWRRLTLLNTFWLPELITVLPDPNQ